MRLFLLYFLNFVFISSVCLVFFCFKLLIWSEKSPNACVWHLTEVAWGCLWPLVHRW
jgi:hypothetical protein